MAVKLYISQPMRGKAMNDIMAERKQLVAEAASEYEMRILYGKG